MRHINKFQKPHGVIEHHQHKHQPFADMLSPALVFNSTRRPKTHSQHNHQRQKQKPLCLKKYTIEKDCLIPTDQPLYPPQPHPSPFIIFL